MSDDRLLFGYLRRKLGALSQADVDEFNAVLREWKASNGLTASPDAPVSPTGPSEASGQGPVPGGAPAPSDAAFAIIKEFEGYAKDIGGGRVEAYPDPASGGDPWTIGYGSTGPDVKRGTVWTYEQAEERLAADVRRFAAGVAAALGGAATTQSQFDALVSFAYNVGLANLKSSTLLRKHKAGDKSGAAAEFGKWVNASGKRMTGLVRRRAAEAALYRGQS